jgi:hypothetical protein
LNAPLRPPHERSAQVSWALSVAPVVESARVDPVQVPGPVELEVAADIVPGTHETESCLLADKPWVCGVQGFAAPPTPQEAFPGPATGKGPPKPPGFLGRAVGGIHDSVQFWRETFESDVYVEIFLQHGYKIPVKMSPGEAKTVYRERNNKSARNEAAYVLEEVRRLFREGQVVETKTPPRCTNPLSVAFKVNPDGSIKNRLVIDLSRWVNKFVVPDRFRMARFQDALA